MIIIVQRIFFTVIMKYFLLLFILLSIRQVEALNLLMIPLATAFSSHFLNFDIMADLVQSHGHNVTILVNSRMKPLMKTTNVTFYEAPVPEEDFISTEIDPKIIEGYWKIDSIWSFYTVMTRYMLLIISAHDLPGLFIR